MWKLDLLPLPSKHYRCHPCHSNEQFFRIACEAPSYDKVYDKVYDEVYDKVYDKVWDKAPPAVRIGARGFRIGSKTQRRTKLTKSPFYRKP